MKSDIRFIAVILFAVITTAAATAAVTAPAQPETRIELDPGARGAILFVVGGKEEARIDRTGLHVREDVDYGGTLTDAGTAGYDGRAHAQ